MGTLCHAPFQHSPSAAAAAAALPFCRPRTVKIVVSATLTRDPSKLQRLALHCPRYVATSASGKRYRLPPGLQEFRLQTAGAHKPAALLALLQQLRGESTVVFASSRDVTHKWVQQLGSFCATGSYFENLCAPSSHQKE